MKYNPQNNWVCRAIELAADNEILSRSNLKARPGDFITKAEALAMIMKAANISYEKNVLRNGYPLDLKQWQIDLISAADKNRFIKGSSFDANGLATRSDVFTWTKNIIGDSWQHEGIDLYFKNINIPETISVDAESFSGTFSFCVSGQESLADKGIDIYPGMILGEGLIIVNSDLSPILQLKGGECFHLSFTQKIPTTFGFKIDSENRVDEINERNNSYLN